MKFGSPLYFAEFVEEKNVVPQPVSALVSALNTFINQ